MKNPILHSQSFYIDGEEINIPIAIFNEGKKRTILITGGIDGDEYSGTRAAYELIENFKKLKSDYRLIIIPIVNIYGNKDGVSHNPRDGKFPKYIYPGKHNGSSSEQLIFQLGFFISQSFLWVDLHSGSTNEKLKPFIWTWKTKNKKVNDITKSFLSNFSDDEIIYQKDSASKTEELAKRNISYLMLESGELGEEKAEAIGKHNEWLKKIIAGKFSIDNPAVYRKVKFYKSKIKGKWKPKLLPGYISEKKLVGLVEDKEIFTDQEGLILYIKKPMFVEKGEELFAVAYVKESI